MLNLSPQVGELLLKATQSHDLDEALRKVLREYLALKLDALCTEIRQFEEQWGCPFLEFKENTKEEYTYEFEQAFWQWEQLETLKTHYQALRDQWN